MLEIRQQIEKIVFWGFFALFCDDMGHFFNFFVFFYVYKYWDSRYEKIPLSLSSFYRPATRIFVRKDRHSVHLLI